MARKATNGQKHDPVSESESEDHEADLSTEPPSDINPYEILSIEKEATQDQIKSAYRRAALKHHPDKANAESRDEANRKFQEIAFAYAILSDEKRRIRYDTTGNTAESLEDDDFDWVDFFREQTQAMVSADMIEKIKKEYQGSEEERLDILRVYEEYEGDMDAIYEDIMCSNVLDDDHRFRKVIDDAIKRGEVDVYERYTKESAASKKDRKRKAKTEEAEAMELAEELGVKDKLFGTGSSKSKGSKKKGANDEDALKALIQQRQKDRSENFFDQLEAKYGGNKSAKSKRKVDEPPEELFQANAKKSRSKAR